MFFETGLTKRESDFIKICVQNGIEFDEDSHWIQPIRDGRLILGNELVANDFEDTPPSLSNFIDDLDGSIYNLIRILPDLTYFPPIWNQMTGETYRITIKLNRYSITGGVSLTITAEET